MGAVDLRRAGIEGNLAQLRVLFRKRWAMAWMLKTIEMEQVGRD